MRSVFGLVALLLVVLIVGIAARHQLQAVRQPLAVPGVAADASGASAPLNTAQQARQIEQQVGDSVNQMMRQRTEQLDQQEQGQEQEKPQP